MKRKLLSLLLALCLLLGVLPAALPLFADAAEEKYPLWVGGVQVTSRNRYNIPSVKAGEAAYDPETRTLTLEEVSGLTGSCQFGGSLAGVYAKGIDLTVIGVQTDTSVFARDNLINGSEYGLYIEGGNLTLGGKLKFTGGGNCEALYVDGKLTVEETAAIIAETPKTNAVVTHTGFEMRGGTLTAAGGIAGIRTHGEALISGGTIKATGDRYGFTNENYFLNHPKYTQTGGVLTAEARADDGVGFYCYGECFFEPGDDVSEIGAVGKGGAVLSDRANGIHLSDGVCFASPAGGRLSSDGKSVVDGENQTAERAVLRRFVEYQLSVGGEDVTSANRDDLGAVLAAKNAANKTAYDNGTLKVSFDGDHTLSVAGPITLNGAFLRSELPGLVISVTGDATVKNTGTSDIVDLFADTVITGGKLTLTGGDAGIYMRDSCLLTLDHTDLVLNSVLWGISGYEYPGYTSCLLVDQSSVSVTATTGAVSDFQGGITLKDCSVKTPSNYTGLDEGTISTGGARAKTVVIEPVYEFTRQPVGGVVEKDCYLYVEWAVNFTPLKTEWLSESGVYMSGGGDYTGYSFSAGGPRRVRQYYSSTGYVTSERFTVREAAEDEVVKYPLYLGGIQVTSENRQDLGKVLSGLSDDNRAEYEAGRLRVSFNGSFTLSLSGSIKTGAACVENKGIHGLDIYLEDDVVLRSTGADALVLETDSEIYGPGDLEAVSDMGNAVRVDNSAGLLLSGINVKAAGKLGGIVGNGSKSNYEKLRILQSNVEASGEPAVGRFNRGIELQFCDVVAPENGNISGGSVRRDDDSEATAVQIARDRYSLWVGGVRVTRENMDDIPGVTGGKASYDPMTKTLHLENVTGVIGGYIYDVSYAGAQICNRERRLTITGKATLEGDTHDGNPLVYSGGRLVIEGDLTIRTETGVGLSSWGGLVVKNGKLYAESSEATAVSTTNTGIVILDSEVTALGGNSGLSSARSVEIEGSTVTAKGTSGYGIYSGSGSGNVLTIRNSTVRAEAAGSKSVVVCNYGRIRLLEGASLDVEHTGTETVRSALYSREPIEIHESLKIVEPADGRLNDNGTGVLTADGKNASHVIILKPHVHTVETVKEVPATCEGTGVKAYYRCTGCGALFEDAAGTKETSAEALVLPATGHDWGEWTVTKPATVTSEGEETRVCRNDPAHKETRTIPKLKVMLGDVDDDKVITAADARLALRRAVELESYPSGSREFTACDVDRDAVVTAADARLILRAAVELEDPTKW